MIIWLPSYPKSGNTFLRSLLAAYFFTKDGIINNFELLKNIASLNKVSLLTPNIPEAEILTGTKIKTKEDMIFAASILIRIGAKNVFIKGGHLKSNIVEDIFVSKKSCTPETLNLSACADTSADTKKSFFFVSFL